MIRIFWICKTYSVIKIIESVSFDFNFVIFLERTFCLLEVAYAIISKFNIQDFIYVQDVSSTIQQCQS